MAYVQPKLWAHGDVPTAVEINKYITALNDIKVILDSTPKNPATHMFDGDEDDAKFQLVHINRYLRYSDEAILSNILDASQTVNLPEPEGNVRGVYDLDTIGWLSYGMTYKVVGCSWVIEDYEA